MSNFGYFVAELGNRGMGRALRHRDFRLYALAGWVSNIGLWIQRTALFWLVWELTGSFSTLGGIAFAEALTTILVMPYSGIITDRFNRRKLAIIVQTILLSFSIILTIFSALELISIFILFGFVMLNGVAQGFWTPLRMAIQPSLVPPEDLPAALGFSATMFNLAQFAGPAIGGIIISSLGVTFAFAANAISFLGYLLALLIIKLKYEEILEYRESGFVADFKEGITYILNTPNLKEFLALSLGVSLFLRAYRELFAGISDGIFEMGVEGLAILSSASGLGAMAAAVYIGSSGRLKGVIRLIMISLIIAMIAQAVLATTNYFWVAVCCAGVLSGAATYAGIGGQLIVQRAIGGAVRGRVMSVWGMILRGGPASGAWMIGLLAGYSNLQMAFLTATLLFLAVWIWAASHMKNMTRNLEIISKQ